MHYEYGNFEIPQVSTFLFSELSWIVYFVAGNRMATRMSLEAGGASKDDFAGILFPSVLL